MGHTPLTGIFKNYLRCHRRACFCLALTASPTFLEVPCRGYCSSALWAGYAEGGRVMPARRAAQYHGRAADAQPLYAFAALPRMSSQRVWVPANGSVDQIQARVIAANTA